MHKSFRLLMILMILVTNSFCFYHDIRMHFIRRDLYRTTSYLIYYWEEKYDYPHLESNEFIKEFQFPSADALKRSVRDFEYNYINKYMFELKAITKFNFGKGYSVFYINPDGAFWADNIADESDSIEDIQWEKVNHQVIRVTPVGGGDHLPLNLSLPELKWHDK